MTDIPHQGTLLNLDRELELFEEAWGKEALPEIADGAAVLVKAEDPESIADGIQRALDPSTRTELRRKGFARAKLLSWERTARATLAAYREVAG